MKKTKKRGFFLIILGLALIMAAIAIAAYNIWDDYRASSASESILNDFKEARERNIEILRKEQDIYPEAPYEEQTSPDYLRDPYMPMPTITIDGYRYIGTVTIPALELELPVMEEWDYTRMKIAPCRYSGSAYLDNLVVCAHNYNSHFGHIYSLQENDDVIFVDAVGNIFNYKVDEIQTLQATAVEEMTTSDWDFTLFTCTYSGRSRVTIRCKLS